MLYNDTIAAIATALSDSGIGIIRVSGSQAIDICDAIFKSPSHKRLSECATHTIHYGHIYNPEKDEIIDEVMVSIMRGPKSFTAEDTVEINCHGGVLIVKKVLNIVLLHGARMAEPGEFTKRAFLNGRIDLSKAEAVIDVIHSQNEYALKSSMSQLQGSLSNKIRELRGQIIYEIAFIESALDDPEHISMDGYQEELYSKTKIIMLEIEKMIQTADNGRFIKEGIQTVIVGKPNAGKSSLLNQLIGEERAIVTNVAGTTRDILQETIQLRGIGLNIIDTAGIHTTEDIVEKIGVDKAKDYANQADLVIYVIDGLQPLDENDDNILDMIKNKNVICLLNKSDLDTQVTGQQVQELLNKAGMVNVPIISTSTKNNTGLDVLEEKIEKIFFDGNIKVNNEVVITNIRHKDALQKAFESLKLVLDSINNDLPEDFYSIDLMSAYSYLGYIIGEEIEDDLVEEIFSKFCMGK